MSSYLGWLLYLQMIKGKKVNGSGERGMIIFSFGLGDYGASARSGTLQWRLSHRDFKTQ